MIPVFLFNVVRFVGVVIAVLILYAGWTHGEKTGGLPLAGMAAGAIVWGVMQILNTYVSDYPLSVALNNLVYVGVVTIVVSFFVLAAQYAGYDRFLTRRTLALLAVEPVIVQVLVWTNHYHGWFFAKVMSYPANPTGIRVVHGVAFWGHTVYSYALLLVGVVLLGQMIYRRYRRDDLFVGQMAAIVVAVVVPTTINALSITDVLPVDVSSTGFAVSSVALAYALFRYELVDLSPVARSTVVGDLEDGVVVLDADDRVIDVNRTGAAMLGIESSAIGTHAGELLDRFPDVWERLRDVDRGTEEFELDTDAGRRTYHVKVSPLTAGHEDRSGRLFQVHDVTERKRREEELRRQNDQLEQFASLVSHDLRNPLNVADGYLEIAMEADDPSRKDEHMAEVDHSHDRMRDLIDDVLTLAREGQTVEEPRPTDLERVARDAWGNVDTKSATLDVRTDRTIQADEDRLLRVFENLFRNAVEHGGEGVTIRVGSIGSDGSGVVERERGFYVADDGPGIPEDDRDDVLEDGYTTASDGTGLGLSIVTSIVEAHGWSIAVTESEEGGAKFDVTGVSLGT